MENHSLRSAALEVNGFQPVAAGPEEFSPTFLIVLAPRRTVHEFWQSIIRAADYYG